MREIYSANIQTANQDFYYIAAPGLPLDSAPVGETISIPFPSVWIGPGDKIFTSTDSLDSNDIITCWVGYVKAPHS